MHAKTALKKHPRGYHVRYLGYSPAGGRKKQAKFYLDRDEQKAKQADIRLEALWRRVLEHETGWTPETLATAKAICHGRLRYEMPPNPSMSGAESYVHWVERYAGRYGDIIPIAPQEKDLYYRGFARMRREREERLRWLDAAFPVMPYRG
jgi:hypothetical protein